MTEHLESKPDPIARQSDLEILRAEQKAEHWKTRLAVLGVTVVANASKLSVLLGYGAIHWWPW